MFIFEHTPVSRVVSFESDDYGAADAAVFQAAANWLREQDGAGMIVSAVNVEYRPDPEKSGEGTITLTLYLLPA